ncbi:MAG TPA: PTS sugar transporter subunit IIA [Anaerolineaceae bacterium]|jgi:mannitol/fructose-specific phosphotransferase system IIA component|nr:PTS sugar transporter subunit IIA [Anaerolineaceae bacterium]HPT22910.1 PTS sugar transporter subunit IIA [Anaerolineaceae bacterium]
MADILSLETVEVQAHVSSKEEAITRAGELLVRAGCVEKDYVKGMLARELTMSTFIGNGVSIPHGEFGDLQLVNRTGISVLQVPEGVEWEEGNIAYLVVGIAAVGDEHIKVLQNLAEVVEDESIAEMLAHTTDAQVIVDHLNKPVEEEE